MILIDHPVSPYAQKVRMVLFEKQIDFESREMWSKSQRGELCLLLTHSELSAHHLALPNVGKSSPVLIESARRRQPT